MIYVCVPARDEARTVGPLLWKVRKVFGEFDREFRLVVFDDGSTDDTREVLQRYVGILPLTVLSSDTPVGYGAAVDRLLRHVVEVAPYPKRDAAVVLQADFSESPEYLVDLVKTLEGGADVVASSIDVRGDETLPKPRVWGRRLAPLALGRAWRTAPVEDPLSGMRAYRTIVLKKAMRDGDAPLCDAHVPWVANLQVLHRVVGYARRVDDTPIRLRYPLPARESRFRAWPALKALLSRRGTRWPEVDSEGGKRSSKSGGDRKASKPKPKSDSGPKSKSKDEGRETVAVAAGAADDASSPAPDRDGAAESGQGARRSGRRRGGRGRGRRKGSGGGGERTPENGS